MRQVVLERAAIRRERREVARVQVQLELVGDDDAAVAERLVRVHRALEALREADRLDARAEPAGWGLQEALEERLEAREDPHGGRC
jgi:hypothetical protein